MNAALDLPLFKEQLNHLPADALSQATRWRYSNGNLPRILLLLIEQPKLMTALAADAEALAANRDAFQSPRTGEADQPADD